jgi:small-conductance mechanosensitive channel
VKRRDLLFGNDTETLLLAASITAITLLLIWAVRALIKRWARHAHKTESEFDDFFLEGAHRTKLYLLILPALYLGARALILPHDFFRLLKMAMQLSLIAQTALWVAGIADFWLRRYKRQRAAEDPSAVMTLNVFRIAIVSAVWIVAVIAAIDNLGFNVGAVLTGLGIGGVAVALALQNILGDLFASLSIVIDKPFVPGDFIVIGPESGRVEHIGLKTTRLRSPGGEELIIGNGDLLKARVHNMKRMTERRTLLRFAVNHSTPPETLERIPLMIRAAVEKHERARFDRAHLLTIGPTGLEYEAVWWVTDREFVLAADIQQAVNLDLLRAFAAERVELASGATGK